MGSSWTGSAARMVTSAMAALLMALACGPGAHAATQPLDGGLTRIDLNRGLVKALRQEGVALEAWGLATLKGRKLTLPVTSGTSDTETGQATLVHKGGFRLALGGRRIVTLLALRLSASAKTLTATVAGRKMRLADLGAAKLERDGFDTRLSARRLRLTRAAAAAINRVLGLPGVLRPGRSLGAVRGLGEPTAVEIGEGSIWMGGPDTVFSRLESLQVQIGIWGATQRWTAPGEKFFGFQTAPTSVSPDALTGIISGNARDGVTMEIFESPPRNMLLRGPQIDLATRELSATVSALSAADPVTTPIATLDYSAAKFQVRPSVGAFELIGIRAISNQFIADQLNERFMAPGTFQAGETLALITVNLSAKK